MDYVIIKVARRLLAAAKAMAQGIEPEAPWTAKEYSLASRDGDAAGCDPRRGGGAGKGQGRRTASQCSRGGEGSCGGNGASALQGMDALACSRRKTTNSSPIPTRAPDGASSSAASGCPSRSPRSCRARLGARPRSRSWARSSIAFRDTAGRVGILEECCPHRHASLYWGRNEESGLRCVYHGWKFDVATAPASTSPPSRPTAASRTSSIAPSLRDPRGRRHHLGLHGPEGQGPAVPRVRVLPHAGQPTARQPSCCRSATTCRRSKATTTRSRRQLSPQHPPGRRELPNPLLAELDATGIRGGSRSCAMGPFDADEPFPFAAGQPPSDVLTVQTRERESGRTLPPHCCRSTPPELPDGRRRCASAGALVDDAVLLHGGHRRAEHLRQQHAHPDRQREPDVLPAALELRADSAEGPRRVQARRAIFYPALRPGRGRRETTSTTTTTSTVWRSATSAIRASRRSRCRTSP